MSDIAIKVEGIGKKYRIGQKKSGELRETFGNIFRSFKLTANSQQPGANKDFWALKDISFEVKQGEAVGIIGRNGAGKSTLLKVLSRITKPTTGRFEINGRVSSLLEVGTGFHPELTGRENIYLNGTILGMRRNEIRSRFDEIIAFSGVEEFIDTPVKHYSSGMKVRLAFSVAAHLEPEILIIDEVLAVGDAEFQKKCLGKMEDVTGAGRTVLFVSHNMGAVKSLCKDSILLERGFLVSKGSVEKIIYQYLNKGKSSMLDSSNYINHNDYSYETHTFKRMALTDENGQILNYQINKNQQAFFEIEIEIHQLDPSLNIGYGLYTAENELLYWSFFKDSSEDSWPKIRNGINVYRSKLPIEILNEGRYQIEYIAALHHKKWLLEPATDNPRISFETFPGNYESPLLGLTKRKGSLMPIYAWYNV